MGQHSPIVADFVGKQFTTDSLRASPLFDDRGDDEVNADSVPLGGTVTEVAAKAALTAVVDLLGKATTKLVDSALLSSTAMSVDYIEKNSGDTAIPKPLGELTALASDADNWPIVGDDAMGKGQHKRPANSAPGSVSPGTGGTNPRRGPSARSGNSIPDSSSPGSSVINTRTDGDTPSEWITKKGGKNASPNSVTDATTPLRYNRSGYPVIVTVPTTEKIGKKKRYLVRL